jgi:hypothetical protein
VDAVSMPRNKVEDTNGNAVVSVYLRKFEGDEIVQQQQCKFSEYVQRLTLPRRFS